MTERLSLLSQSPLFEMLSNDELSFVAGLSHERTCEPGERVVEEGELDDRLFIITQGEVEVCRSGQAADGRPLAVLAPFQFFGEMGLLEKDSRSATVLARTRAHLVWLSAEELTSFRQAFPRGYTLLVINIARVLSHRLRLANDQLRALEAGQLTPGTPSP